MENSCEESILFPPAHSTLFCPIPASPRPHTAHFFDSCPQVIVELNKVICAEAAKAAEQATQL